MLPKKNALIIFVRKPELGKVKTRLAATVGNEKALSIYKELLQHTYKISTATNAAKFIFYANEIDENDNWNGINIYKEKQSNGDLGERMKTAFTKVFKQGYEKVIIIGSDCFELTENIIKDAFAALTENDAVIGPAKDGGYYLLGMKKIIVPVFKNKSWSTENVFADTISDLEKAHLSYTALMTLTDVDTEEDWLKHKSTAL